MTKPTNMWGGFLSELREHLQGDISKFETWPVIKRTMFTEDSKHEGFLQYFESNICKFSEVDNIFEFGGGHGRVCKLIYERGFDSSYAILDFPELSLLQKYYLRDFNNIQYLNDIDALPGVVNNSLFVSMSAIEESPEDVKNKMFEYANKFDKFLFKCIGYSRDEFINFVKKNCSEWYEMSGERGKVHWVVGEK